MKVCTTLRIYCCAAVWNNWHLFTARQLC